MSQAARGLVLRPLSAGAADRLPGPLWLGGMSGTGKTTAARALARRHDLRLYSLDARTYEHASRLAPEPRTLDELWVDTTPAELASWFERHARERFPLILEDLAALPRDAPVIVDGPQLLPQLVAPLLGSRREALYVVARPELQRRLVIGRGSDLYGRTRDPARALANRLGRDEVLARRLRRSAETAGLDVLEIADVHETAAAVAAWFEPLLREWSAGADRGDVSARRRDENDVRLRQLRAHVEATGGDATRELGLACECARPGCAEVVQISLAGAEAARSNASPLLAAGHR